MRLNAPYLLDAETVMQRGEIPKGARERILGHVVKRVVIVAVYK